MHGDLFPWWIRHHIWTLVIIGCILTWNPLTVYKWLCASTHFTVHSFDRLTDISQANNKHAAEGSNIPQLHVFYCALGMRDYLPFTLKKQLVLNTKREKPASEWPAILSYIKMHKSEHEFCCLFQKMRSIFSYGPHSGWLSNDFSRRIAKKERMRYNENVTK